MECSTAYWKHNYKHVTQPVESVYTVSLTLVTSFRRLLQCYIDGLQTNPGRRAPLLSEKDDDEYTVHEDLQPYSEDIKYDVRQTIKRSAAKSVATEQTLMMYGSMAAYGTTMHHVFANNLELGLSPLNALMSGLMTTTVDDAIGVPMRTTWSTMVGASTLYEAHNLVKWLTSKGDDKYET